jgi:hypothetical protein
MSRAEYFRTYRKTAAARNERKAFIAGWTALQTELVETFQVIGRGEMSGFTALEIVRNTSPKVPRGTHPQT